MSKVNKDIRVNIYTEAGEVVEWLKAPAALAEDTGSVPGTPVMAHNHL